MGTTWSWSLKHRKKYFWEKRDWRRIWLKKPSWNSIKKTTINKIKIDLPINYPIWIIILHFDHTVTFIRYQSFIHNFNTLVGSADHHCKMELVFRPLLITIWESGVVWFIKNYFLLFGVDGHFYLIFMPKNPILQLRVIILIRVIICEPRIDNYIASMVTIRTKCITTCLNFIFVPNSYSNHSCDISNFKCARLFCWFLIDFVDGRVQQGDPIGIANIHRYFDTISQNNIFMHFRTLKEILLFCRLIDAKQLDQFEIWLLFFDWLPKFLEALPIRFQDAINKTLEIWEPLIFIFRNEIIFGDVSIELIHAIYFTIYEFFRLTLPI